jgi:hypothetical protein
MKLSGNQAFNLLYIHYKEPWHNLGLTLDELGYLKQKVVLYWEKITSPYKEYLVSDNLDDICEAFIDNKCIFR